MNQTTLFPPFTAIRIAWAITGKFTKEEESKLSAAIAEDNLKEIKNRAAAIGSKEQQYIDGAISTTLSTLRSLEIVLKGRNLNFDENQKVKDIYLENIKDNITFGNTVKDFFKSLPTMSITTGIGTISVTQLLDKLSGGKTDSITWVFIALACAGAGYLINLAVKRAMREKIQLQYISQDYERNIYFEQYINRIQIILTSLYEDIDRIHTNIFGNPYPEKRKSYEITDDLLRGVRSTMCEFVHKHMKEKVITPDLWPICEAGGKITKQCKLWEGIKN